MTFLYALATLWLKVKQSLSKIYPKILEPATTGHKLVYVRQAFLTPVFCFILFSYAHAQSAQERTGAGLNDVRLLQIGDTIPEELWNLPMHVINHPEGKGTITLNDYRENKLIILDLWSTWCGTCIFTLPRTFQTVSKFSDEIALIPITDQSKDLIEPYLAKQKMLKSIPNFYSVVGNNQFMYFFQIKSLPRAIVIDNRGIIITVTQPKYLTDESINKQLNGINADFPRVSNNSRKNPKGQVNATYFNGERKGI